MSKSHSAQSEPSFRLPPGCCDTHVHLFGPREKYPFAGAVPYSVADASLPSLQALHQRLRLGRSVIVNAEAYGPHHQIAIDAIAQSGGLYRGVANLDASASERQIESFHAQGFRGYRFRFLAQWPDLDLMERIAAMAAPWEWHLDLLINAAQLPDVAPVLKRLPIRYVIDHMGRVNARAGVDQPEVQDMLGLMRDDEKCWVKLSGADRLMLRGATPDEVAAIARTILQTAPDRVLWGTDWPHNAMPAAPDDTELVDLIPSYAPEPAWQTKMLVTNPERLYGFEPWCV